MGLIIHDEITLRNGLTVSDVYASFSGKQISIIPASSVTYSGEPREWGTKWVIHGSGYAFWKSKELCKAGFPAIEFRPITIEVTDDDLATKPVFTIVYDYIKNTYKNTEDC